jgi:geranyl-CoA carboxylase alpha subunit
MTLYSKVLVANRGEIAIRVMRGAAKMGYATVAVYSEADREAPHVLAADEAVCIGPAAASESYLAIDHIIEAARASGADAVHPGYGFLAENAAFARAVEDAGLVFIGPPPAVIELMGSKRAAKQRMAEAGVPCVPGYQGDAQDEAALIEEARAIGYPVMVKASAGGGGRGMRLVENEADLADAIASARSEAQNAFGSGELILERAVAAARHVEVQVFADTYGNVVHLGERDCSVQRRHQKVVEEAPSPAIDAALREKMGNAAVEAAAAIGYRGAGTVEFLFEPASGAFYFMEMNTRLQVEHPVTEMITGLDLVEWQLRVAAGEPLPLAQDAITFDGHAMEVRLCAEDPDNGFMPQTGRILAWRAPAAAHVRADHCVQAGGEVSPHYDSMVGKIITWGPNRGVARERLIAALECTLLLGVVHNKAFLAQILRYESFAGGDFDIHFIDTHMPREAASAPPPRHVALAAAIVHARDAKALADERGLDRERLNWRSANAAPIISSLARGGQSRDLRLAADPGGHYAVTVDEETFEFQFRHFSEAACHYECNGVLAHADYVVEDGEIWLAVDGATWAFTDTVLQPPEADIADSDGRVVARMDGKIIDLRVTEGERVEAGQKLLVLEAMKMEFQMDAPVAGVVESVSCAAGDQVGANRLLLTIISDEK